MADPSATGVGAGPIVRRVFGSGGESQGWITRSCGVLAFYQSPEYAPIKAERDAAQEARMFVVDVG